jgi:hypothetical protein
MSGANVKRSMKKPDWVDILLAASIAARGTIVSAMFVFAVVPVIFRSPLEAVPAVYAFLVFYCVYGFLVASVVCAVLGLPALALANWLGLSRRWQAAVVGASAGLVVSLLFTNSSALMAGWNDWLCTLLFLVAGAFGGVAAWRERNKGRRTA